MKHNASIIFSTFIVTLAFGFAPAPASAQDSTEQTIETLQAQIADLEAQIAALLQLRETSFTFTRTLRLGSSGNEVLILQQSLNQEPGIMVNDTGAGSPGNETDYFGPLTWKAVQAFQEKYRSEILDPAGLERPTGIVGERTREVLNRLYGDDPSDVVEITDDPDTQQDDTDSPYTTIDLSELEAGENFYIRNQTANTASPGDTFTITGGGFTADTQVVIDRSIIPDIYVEYHSSDSIEVTVPNDAPLGINDLVLVKGTTYSDPKSKIIIKDNGIPNPEITNITQSEDEIRIYGTQFTDDNIVHAQWRRVFHLDGVNGTIILPKEELRDIMGIGTEEDIHFYVINENGISDAVEATIDNLLL